MLLLLLVPSQQTEQGNICGHTDSHICVDTHLQPSLLLPSLTWVHRDVSRSNFCHMYHSGHPHLLVCNLPLQQWGTRLPPSAICLIVQYKSASIAYYNCEPVLLWAQVNDLSTRVQSYVQSLLSFVIQIPFIFSHISQYFYPSSPSMSCSVYL